MNKRHTGSAILEQVKPYIFIARVDHWFKNIFMLPGTAVAVVLADVPLTSIVFPVLAGVLSASLVASANYVINEWLDAEFDKYHPKKKYRPSVTGNINGVFVLLEYIFFLAAGLGIAFTLSVEFLGMAVLFVVMGVIYNVKPFRTKDRVYMDVLSESLNNPIRFMLGWYAVVSGILPPSSILLSYWMGGAFLMAIKRYAEYRFIDDPEQAGLYRRSFRFYTEEKLLVSAFFYSLSSVFFLGIFLIKYKIEFLLSFPLFALLFAWYLSIGMRARSPAQEPGQLYKEKRFVAYLITLSIVVGILIMVDIPWLHVLLKKVSY